MDFCSLADSNVALHYSLIWPRNILHLAAAHKWPATTGEEDKLDIENEIIICAFLPESDN